MSRFIAVALSLLWTTAALAGPREDALAQYEKFFESFRTDNQEQVAALFSPDALFMGTISPDLVTDPAGVKAYFVRALDPARGEVTARVFGTTATQISDDVVLVTALWQAERMEGGKMTTRGPSRNSSVMHRRDGHWYIVQFHNSWQPK